jgi:hypothetical protein
VTQLSAQLEDVVSSANEASDLMENEQMEKRELEEKLNETNVSDYLYTNVHVHVHACDNLLFRHTLTYM